MPFEGWYRCPCGFMHKEGNPNPTHSSEWMREHLEVLLGGKIGPELVIKPGPEWTRYFKDDEP